MKNDLKIYYIDLFCGAGGTTTGIHLTNANVEVIACVNHDEIAIESHEANHPNCEHFHEDIRDFKVVLKIKKIIDELRVKEPNCKIVVWASLECQSFTIALGNKPKSVESRTLANSLFMYLEQLQPDYLYIENVKEFQDWGKLDKNFKVIVSEKGKLYKKWVQKIKSYGYNFESKILNSADFGAYQTRKRYFGIFGKYGLPISFPKPTHCNPVHHHKNKTLQLWNPVREVLNLKDKGNNIFDRKKPYVENTLRRIYYGLQKFATENDFLIKYYTTGNNADSINKPCATVTTKDRFSKVAITWITDTQYNRIGRVIDKPCQTIIARMDKKPLYLVTATQSNGFVTILDGDSEMTIKIKQFMIRHGISEVAMRGAKVQELKEIQGFPKDYILKGVQKDQKKHIGNAVEVNQATALIEANYTALQYHKKAV